MRGDFSRLTFRPENHYSGVRLQQGRVQLDAEFNEHVDIEAHRDRETARDVIGRSGAPQEGGGFGVGIASMLRGVAARGAAWAVGEDGTLLRADGGAATWTLEERPAASGRLNAVAFADDTTAWAVGDGAAIYRLAGAAHTRATLPTGVTADLHGVHATSTTAAWAVGSRGAVLGYDGTVWTRQALDTGITAALRGVHGAAITCAVGDAGTIIATGGGAAGWHVEASPADTGDLHGVHVVDAQHRWAVGEQGTILFSDGAAWSRQGVALPLTSTLRAVVFTDAARGTAVGDDGTIVATTDGGATWNRQVVPDLTADLHDVVARNDGTLLAVGDDVALARDAAGVWTHAPQLPADAATGARKGRTLTLSAGDLYVDGIRCENGRTVSLGAQPEPPLEGLHRAPGGAGTFGVYLQVQEQHLTAVEREELREVALGGPDTATRTRIVWQADVVRIAAADPGCADVVAAVRSEAIRGRLRARAKPSEVSTSGCIVPPTGGYERLENQLYRVEIHSGSNGSAASFKWSRDNGSMVARLRDIATTPGTAGAPWTGSVTVSQVGRDATLGFGPEQLVEITDEGRMLRGEPGVLAEVGEVDGNVLSLENLEHGPLTMADFPDRPLVRRWDGRGEAKPLPEEHELESGVFVTFADGAGPGDGFRTGDYWTIPARTLTGAVEWPSTGGVPTFEEPHGPDVSLTPLALVALDAKGTWSGVRECRRRFPPLTDLVHLYYVGGDGQEAKPPMPLDAGNAVPLPLPLRVGVANGGSPLAGAIVDFEVPKAGPGTGQVGEPGGAFAASAAVVTDEDGIATCEWRLDGQATSQVVEARFRDPLGQSPPQVIRFGAQLSVAANVAFDPAGCARLSKSGDVQGAISVLARQVRIFPLSGSGEDVMPGESIEVRVLVADQCGPVDGASVLFEHGKRGTGAITDVQGTTAGGVASCTWTPAGEPFTQDLVATVDDVPAEGEVHHPSSAHFVANLSVARDVEYRPPELCPAFAEAKTVQDAIDRLIGALPRLVHVSGDGLEGAAGEAIPLRVLLINRCGIRRPVVLFERREAGRDPATWEELGTAEPDGDDVAVFDYKLSDDPRQELRAILVEPRGRGTARFGAPVHFTLGIAAADGGGGERVVPAARLRNWDVPLGEFGRQWMTVPFRDDSVEFDTTGAFEPGADDTTLRASRNGTYLIVGELMWDQINGDMRPALTLVRNGNQIGGMSGGGHEFGQPVTQQASAIVQMKERDDGVQLQASWGIDEPMRVLSATLSLAWLGP